jgi:hypothetical protein
MAIRQWLTRSNRFANTRENYNSRVSRHLELCLRDLPLKATRHLTREPRPNVEWTVEEIVDAASLGVLPVTGH